MLVSGHNTYNSTDLDLHPEFYFEFCFDQGDLFYDKSKGEAVEFN